jgi:hypothetical protein
MMRITNRVSLYIGYLKIVVMTVWVLSATGPGELLRGCGIQGGAGNYRSMIKLITETVILDHIRTLVQIIFPALGIMYTYHSS